MYSIVFYKRDLFLDSLCCKHPQLTVEKRRLDYMYLFCLKLEQVLEGHYFSEP